VARIARLHRKLGDCDLRPFAPLPPRARRGQGGRSKARHERLVAEILAEESKVIAHLEGVNFDLSRRARLRDMLAESEDTTP
jgi:hypothetical protein